VQVLPRRVAAHRVNVDAFEQPVQLLGRPFDHRLLAAGPGKAVCLKAFHQHPEARAVVQQQLDPVAPTVVEREHGARKRTSCIDCSTSVTRLFMPARKSIGSR
jgi:hypothetical protein